MGCWPPSRSMILSRACPKPTRESTWKPKLSGPRCASARTIFCSHGGGGPPAVLAIPAIPHIIGFGNIEIGNDEEKHVGRHRRQKHVQRGVARSILHSIGILACHRTAMTPIRCRGFNPRQSRPAVVPWASQPARAPVLPTALTLRHMKCYCLVPETRSCYSLFGGVMLSLPPMLGLCQAPARYNVGRPLSAN